MPSVYKMAWTALDADEQVTAYHQLDGLVRYLVLAGGPNLWIVRRASSEASHGRTVGQFVSRGAAMKWVQEKVAREGA